MDLFPNSSKSEFLEGDTEHKSGVYLDVREHSSTGSTYPQFTCDWLYTIPDNCV
ncbi:MAG: palindromic element RPE1 domain-containing protein [Holosporales bacterium]|nr:palindromic element RPE1 domain-containing protein [Holosporales bacterium]